MNAQLSGLIYFIVGLAIIYLFQVRRKSLSTLKHEDFQEMADEDFEELKILLKTAYERMLYMGVVFFPLAYTSFVNGANVSKLVFLVLIALLFISNIPPRNKIMRLLERYELSISFLRDRNIKL